MQPQHLRPDGRGPEEFRPLFYDTRVLSQARGSAYVEVGDTKVMAGVFGPRQSEVKFGFSERGRLMCDVRATSFAGGGTGAKQEAAAREKALAAEIVAALEPCVQLDAFPKAVVHVMVMLLEASGGELPAAVTAASLALADAGIAMNDLCPCCQVVRSTHGTLLLDPSTQEAAAGSASLVVAHMPSLNEVTQLSVTGCWGRLGEGGGERGSLQAALQLGLGGCLQLREEMRAVLTAKLPPAPSAG